MASNGVRRRVVEWEAAGMGIFNYTLSCGHKTQRVGIIPRGYAMERPADTCACYECSRAAVHAQRGAVS